jgi:hypothetical protein
VKQNGCAVMTHRGEGEMAASDNTVGAQWLLYAAKWL